jgi:hypothetical protein
MRPYCQDLGNRVGGPGDYRHTERLADDSLAERGSWVYHKAGVIIPLSAWTRYNCGGQLPPLKDRARRPGTGS